MRATTYDRRMHDHDIPDAVIKPLREESRFAAAILFGSAARGALRPESDIDLAYLATDDRAARSIAAELMEWIGMLGEKALRDVHLIELSSAPLPLRRVVFDRGRTLFDRSGGRLRDLHRSTAVEYVDNAYLRQIADRALDARLEEPDGRR